MKPFDDTIPEENTPPYQDLVSLLRQATPASSVTPEEHSQMLTRVRARLHQTDEVSSEDMSTFTENPGSLSPFSLLKRKATQRSSRMRYTLNMIAAVLVISVIVGASLFLFTSHQNSSGSNISIGTPVGPIKAPTIIRSQAGGLEASLQVTSGPYFLSELLDITATLTNHSNKSVFLQGGPGTLNFCVSGALTLITKGGGSPLVNLPSNNIPTTTCFFTQAELTPGNTLIMQGYIPLTKSGPIMLILEAKFLSVTKGKTSSGTDPLYQHWPVMRINVATHIPPDRVILLKQQSSQVLINAPITARSHLVGYETISCIEAGSNKAGSSANLGWDTFATTTLSEPSCGGTNKHWTYVVGAPGYAIVSGEMSS